MKGITYQGGTKQWAEVLGRRKNLGMQVLGSVEVGRHTNKSLLGGIPKEGRFFIGCETEELTLPFALKVIGNEPFMYSSDFPHEVTNQSCKHDIAELLESEELSIRLQIFHQGG